MKIHSIKSPGQDMEEDKHHKQQPGARMLVFVDVYSCFHNYRMHHMQPVYREIKDDVMLLNSKASTMLDRVKYQHNHARRKLIGADLIRFIQTQP